ncbi:PucR family transcriptional regulator [Micromonospora thermarum]|uniref:Transcriptional regulator n=1 Tax=Micromonospora thermarum TaxID=2720024 RepID=A0ABX0ZG35_9ACTN|nr:helix-turn-helix domain-containing protein [Micromonospora thermarum]NJP35509.1 transcriptional regulator [Micromonospora thermarum]
MSPDPQPLTEQCQTLLQLPPGTHRCHPAAALGRQAANSGHSIDDLVAAMLGAASRTWTNNTPPRDETSAAVHSRAADLLDATTDILNAAIAGFHDHVYRQLADNDDQRTEFVNDLLTGRADPGHLAERAHRYGIRLSGRHIVTIAASPALTDAVVRDIDAALASRYGSGNTLTTLRDGQLVCISTGGLRGLPAELAHHLLAQLGAGSWQIGVGRQHSGINGIATSLQEARNTLDLAGKLGFTTPVLNAADLLVFPVLLRDRDAITDLVTTVLGPLQQARGGAQPYLDTLAVLFENQGNHTATARQMHLSVRAVTYRLDRIHTLTGYHPNEPTQRFTLHTAVLGARLLGWPDNEPSP